MSMKRAIRAALIVMLCVLTAGVVMAQEEETGKKKKRSGLRRGAVTGAGLGLALGALTGDAELALKGAATGAARGLAVGENAIRVLLQNITSEGYDEAVNGYTLLKYEPGQGFFLESSFSILDELLNGVGEYKVDQNAYDFYMVDPTSGEMMTGGLMRSNVRVMISIVSPTKWTAEAFTIVDGEEIKAQSYTFTRP
jgi:hypothetical protein